MKQFGWKANWNQLGRFSLEEPEPDYYHPNFMASTKLTPTAAELIAEVAATPSRVGKLKLVLDVVGDTKPDGKRFPTPLLSTTEGDIEKTTLELDVDDIGVACKVVVLVLGSFHPRFPGPGETLDLKLH
ncbi:hypothetical protein V6N11_078642 [Hibiscus sabdariffa]|uniref:Uncharacterized protein n=1 Tax=Hibiscus sabdariffa TaxID=183260 RepID=A0ABR2TGP0_9ROSI